MPFRYSVELSNIFFEIFGFFRPFFDFLALLLGKRGLPYENIGRDLHFAPVVGPFVILKSNSQEPGSGNFENFEH